MQHFIQPQLQISDGQHRWSACVVRLSFVFFFLDGALLPLSSLFAWSFESHPLSLPRTLRAVMVVDALSDDRMVVPLHLPSFCWIYD